MKTLYILSASDRFNYGDLIFPLIAERMLRDCCRIVNVAVIRSDLSGLGAAPTVAYRHLWNDLSRTEDRSTILVAGGEVLGADWATLYSFCHRWFRLIYRICGVRRLSNQVLEAIVRRYVGCGEQKPFLPLSDHIRRNFDLLFHAVGGSDIHRDPRRLQVRNALAAAKYLTAREEDTFNSIKTGLGVNTVRLTPDTAILMSNYFSASAPKGLTGYICLQVRSECQGESLEVLCEQARDLHEQTKRKILLLPIGNCPGHDDYIPLRHLQSRLGNRTLFVSPKSISDVMSTIANADLFIGTSLHGIITAMSFGVPYLGLDHSITKISSYLNTWGVVGLNRVTEFEEVASAGANAIRFNRHVLKDNCEKQKKLVLDSFGRIRAILMQGSFAPLSIALGSLKSVART